ncbi:MAG: site-specific DNA-methyltransferase [Methylococcaceae bacterium]|nr:site-specific DNA-methyltransferase [Methylococcaceae bacterium]MDZ4157554.1 site-specific DNA-methyltransferase [Methylococcales bacterium]MDP2394916.1 site-specific DNA-methyltransferase [Methylococcaceae bacterium]MDP3019337.1 site-specific DNA-methyltransferase [Methylococcaceae bacterium]MDP3389068.1 site-specific DNA-methyltransferase [Methylococcaceae bacterium]
MADNYDDYSREELLRELRLRDRRPRFGLVWERKEIEHEKAVNDDFVALDFDPALSCGEAPYRNLIIEGDNFDALRYLRMTHAGKIKCIYIDPPYNTGNRDFIYNDHFVDKEDAYRHSKWLEFMYRRLQLARDLLAEDGVIFVSIDDNEVFNLAPLMNQVFGERNFIATVIWQKVFSPKNTAMHFSDDHEYVLVYAINRDVWRPNAIPRSEAQDKAYKNPDKDSRGAWTSGDCSARNFYSEGTYPITCPSGRIINGPPPGNYWRFSKKRLDELNADDRIWWGKDGNGVPRLKRFLTDVKQGVVPQTLWKYEEVGHTQDAKKEVQEVMQFEDTASVFSTPKPIRLIERILRIATQPDDIVLDFFAGSGTTAHAVMKLNAEDGGNRRFILVSSTEATEEQIPPNPPFAKGGVDSVIANNEADDAITKGKTHNPDANEETKTPPFEKGGQGGFSNKNLCRDVCAERVRRVIQGYTNKKGEVVAGLGGGFAYLRTHRLPAETLFSSIQHEAIWTALQLIHAESLSPFVADALIQQADLENSTVLYLPKINDAVLQALNTVLVSALTLVVYAWQPGLLRQHFEDARLSFLPIPQFLVDRFGTGSKA